MTAPALPSPTEKQFMAQVLKLAGLYRWKCYHTFDSRHSANGFPDLVLVRDRVIFAELKTAAGRVTPAQQYWIQAIREAGCDCYIWRPENWPDIEHELKPRGA
jgi:hypothetical protein